MEADSPTPGPFQLDLAGDADLERWSEGDPDSSFALVDLVNRVLDKGVVITGHVTISVAGVELVYLGLNALLTSISTAREHLGRPGGRRGGGAQG